MCTCVCNVCAVSCFMHLIIFIFELCSVFVYIVLNVSLKLKSVCTRQRLKKDVCIPYHHNSHLFLPLMNTGKIPMNNTNTQNLHPKPIFHLKLKSCLLPLTESHSTTFVLVAPSETHIDQIFAVDLTYNR